MSSPAFAFPFAHWSVDQYLSKSTASLLENNVLLVGHENGTIWAFTISEDAENAILSAVLYGHQSAILSIQPYLTVSEGTPHEKLFLSLSSDGALSKWSFRDYRCIQSLPVTLHSRRARGMIIVDGGEGRLTESLVAVFGCDTEIAVVNAESLEIVFIWSDHSEWPFPANLDHRNWALLTSTTGVVQHWTLERKVKGQSPEMWTAIRQESQKRTLEEWKIHWGRVLQFISIPTGGGYMIVQSRGISVYEADFRLSCCILMESISGIIMSPNRRLVAVWLSGGEVKILKLSRGKLKLLKNIQKFDRLSPHIIVQMSGLFNVASESGKLIAITRPLAQLKGLGGSLNLSKFDKGLDGSWRNLVIDTPQEGYIPNTGTSEAFSNMLAIAHGSRVRLHSLPSFLLSYQQPSREIELPTTANISLLKRGRIGEYVGRGRGVSVLHGGREFLVAGLSSGDITIIDAHKYLPGKILPLFSEPVVSAHLLPSNLGRRIRSTLFVSSAGGTSAIVDIEQCRAMALFPAHETRRLVAFGTKTSENIISLVYQDEDMCRQWDMSEEEGCVLQNVVWASDSMWRVVHILQSDEDRSMEAESPNWVGDGALECCNLGLAGLPSANVNVRAVLRAVERAAADAKRQSRSQVDTANPAIVNAKSLLTALIWQGCSELLPQDAAEYSVVHDLFFRRKDIGKIGQIGAGGRVSMLTGLEDVESPTLTSITLIAALALVSTLLEALGKKLCIDAAVERIIQSQIARGRKVALGVFAKFWGDSDVLIRWIARECLDAFMNSQSSQELHALMNYWQYFLPTRVPQELSSAKEVLRSVILFGKLMTDYPEEVPEEIRKATATSASLLLKERDHLFQETAIETFGYSWTAFEPYLDSFLCIQTLASLYSEYPIALDALSSISRKNPPVFVSAIATTLSGASATSSESVSKKVADTLRILADAPKLLTRQTLPLLIPHLLTEAASPVLKTLAKVHSTLALDTASHRVAVGSEGVVLVYEGLSTDSVLDAGGMVKALQWAGDSRGLAAVVGEDNYELVVWRLGATGPSGRLLSLIGSATAGDQGERIQPRIRKKIPDGEGDIGFQWVNPREIIVMRGGCEISKVRV